MGMKAIDDNLIIFLPATTGPHRKGWATNKISKIIKKIFFSLIFKKIFLLKRRKIIAANKGPKLKNGKNKNFKNFNISKFSWKKSKRPKNWDS